MVYFKVLLNDKRPKADNIYPVAVRVTYNRNNTTFNTGIRVKSNLWDATALTVKHSHPNSQAYNKAITDFYSKIQNVAYQLINEEEFNFDALKERLSEGYKVLKISKSTFFKEFAEQLITDMLAINKAGNAIVYQTAMNRLMRYANNPKLKFTDITYPFLEGFKRALIKDGVKQNSISNYFRTVRAIYNKAIKAKLVERSHYPFLDIPIKTERTAKRAISVTDIIKIYKGTYKPKTTKWHARNYFLLSFCFRGASFTDMAYLTTDNINKGRLVYKRRKTHGELNIKLLPLAESVIALYDGSNEKYFLPVLSKDIVEDSLNAKKVIMQWIKTTNKWLKRIAIDYDIDAEVTTYVTRHTWATLAKKLGYSNELIAEGLGHQYGNKITNIYLDSFDQSLIDEVNERVIGLIHN
jgi:integrase/recombinase XerD